MPVIRPAGPEDLDGVTAIQQASAEAAHWPAADYLAHEFSVAVEAGQVAGFLVWRGLGEGECEVLNLAVAPSRRRRGVARRLLEGLLAVPGRTIFLEVREANQAARIFYKSMGFQEVNIRRYYYENPPDNAVVMKFHSC